MYNKHDTQHVKKDTNLALSMYPHVRFSKKKRDHSSRLIIVFSDSQSVAGASSKL